MVCSSSCTRFLLASMASASSRSWTDLPYSASWTFSSSIVIIATSHIRVSCVSYTVYLMARAKSILALLVVQSAGAALHHAVVAHHRPDGVKKAFQVPRQGDVGHIFAVQPRLFGDLQLVPAVDLGQAGQPRAHVVGAVLVPLCQQVVLVPQGRPRSDHRHVPLQDVPQLGQFV